jgi:hypothetical protein
MAPAVTGHNDVSFASPNPSVSSGQKIRIAVITSESFEPRRQAEALALRDSAGATDVQLRLLAPAVAGRSTGESMEPVDALLSDGHEETV